VSVEHESPTWERLESQIDWYDSRARSSQLWFKSLKTLELVAAAAIPVTAAAGAGAAVAGALGGVVVILEGMQQLFRFQTDWISYRSTCEALKREKYLFLAGAGPYSAYDERLRILALQVETLVSDETQLWAVAQRELERTGDQRPSG
jgi:hypothetical protein